MDITISEEQIAEAKVMVVDDDDLVTNLDDNLPVQRVGQFLASRRFDNRRTANDFNVTTLRFIQRWNYHPVVDAELVGVFDLRIFNAHKLTEVSRVDYLSR